MEGLQSTLHLALYLKSGNSADFAGIRIGSFHSIDTSTKFKEIVQECLKVDLSCKNMIINIVIYG
jgi:hypothetical protein